MNKLSIIHFTALVFLFLYHRISPAALTINITRQRKVRTLIHRFLMKRNVYKVFRNVYSWIIPDFIRDVALQLQDKVVHLLWAQVAAVVSVRSNKSAVNWAMNSRHVMQQVKNVAQSVYQAYLKHGRHLLPLLLSTHYDYVSVYLKSFSL